MKRYLLTLLLLCFGSAQAIVEISPSGGDDTAALKQATATAKAAHDDLHLAAGYFKLTDTWYLTGSKTVAPIGFETLRVRGSGMGYDNLYGTVIDCSAIKNRPCIVIQNARAVDLADMQILGPNTAPITVGEPVNNQSVYISPGVSANRYCPQAAIAIDLNLGPAPPGGGCVGVTYFNIRMASSLISVRNMFIQRHAVGFVGSPDGYSLNADRVTLDNIFVEYVDIAFSWSQAQARANRANDVNVTYSRIAFSGLDHGLQQGVPPVVTGGQIGYVYKVFRFPASFGSPLSVTGISAESVKVIADWGLGNTSYANAATFTASRFQMENTGWANGPYIAQAFGPMTFENCSIYRPSLTTTFRFIGKQNRYDFGKSSIGHGVVSLVFDDATQPWTNIGHYPN